MQTRGFEAFGRKVTTTASQLMGPLSDPTSHQHYQSAMGEVTKQLRRPTLQRSMFSRARTTPTDLVRSRLSTSEIQQRALSYVPDALLKDIPEDENSYSLFQGFKASFPDFTEDGKKHRRKVSRGRKLIEDVRVDPSSPQAVQKLQKEKAAMLHEFEMLGVRKNMASSEIREIDNKIANLVGMRKIILERLAGFEQDEAVLEHDSKTDNLSCRLVRSLTPASRGCGEPLRRG
jgi:mitochondrial division protein 1